MHPCTTIFKIIFYIFSDSKNEQSEIKKNMLMGGANMITCAVSKVENKGFSSTDVINKG